MTADDALRRAAEEVADAFPPVEHPATPRGESIERLRAALAARSEPLPSDLDPNAVEVAPGTFLHHGLYLRGSEPRAEGLREAAQAVVLAAKKHTPEIMRLNAALAATPPAEGLDVERLTEALGRTLIYIEDMVAATVVSLADAADRIAREYAALAPEQPE